jgi:rare lipoprotein A
MNDLTAAHPSLPLGTFVKVTNLRNGRSVVLRVNDRGPVVDGRIIDVSSNAARVLGFRSQGLQKVRLDVVPSVAMARSARIQ